MTHDPARWHRPAVITIGSVVLTALVALTGCSSSGSSSSTPDSVSPSTHAAAGSTTPSGSSPVAGSTTSAHSVIPAGATFCTQAKLAQAQQTKQAAALAGSSPASLEQLERQDLAELPAFVAAAPSAIKGDLTIVAAADKKLYNALAAVHFDVRKIDPNTFTGLNTPRFKSATSAVGAYLSKQCGIKTTPAA